MFLSHLLLDPLYETWKLGVFLSPVYCGACAFAWAYFIHIAGYLVAPFNLSLAVLQF